MSRRRKTRRPKLPRAGTMTTNEARAELHLPPLAQPDRIPLVAQAPAGWRKWRPILAGATLVLVLVLAAAFVVISMFEATGFATARPAQLRTEHTVRSTPCSTITRCRKAAAWNHSIVVDRNLKLAIANGRAGGGRDLRSCHTLGDCRRLAAEQKHARLWSEAAWRHLRHDNTPQGAMRIVRYRFHPCGRVAQARAHLIVGWESRWQRFNINGAGDTSWWQIEKGSDSPPGHGWDPHPDISVAQAEDAWESTGIAVRWSRCGADWSPTWTSVRDHGMDWP
jgi:hypothetical protein